MLNQEHWNQLEVLHDSSPLSKALIPVIRSFSLVVTFSDHRSVRIYSYMYSYMYSYVYIYMYIYMYSYVYIYMYSYMYNFVFHYDAFIFMTSFLPEFFLFLSSIFLSWIDLPTVSTFTKGEQMIPVLNECKVRCAVFGNHDFGESRNHFFLCLTFFFFLYFSFFFSL